MLSLAAGWVRRLGALSGPQALGQALLSRPGGWGCEPPAGGGCRGPGRDRDRAAELGTKGPRARAEVGRGRTDPAQCVWG